MRVKRKTSKSKVHICFDMTPKNPKQLLRWAELACEVNPANRPLPVSAAYASIVSATCIRGAFDTVETDSFELTQLGMAGLTTKFWKTGQEVTFGFIRASSKIAEHARNGFVEVAKYANLKFKEVSASQATIRISDDEEGAYSYLGTDALGIPLNKKTMNLARSWADASTAIHEICHAIGMIHEHQSPSRPDDFWNVNTVYRDYSGPPNNWSRAQIDANVINRYSKSGTQFTEFDRKSIMLYPLNAAHLKNPSFATGWNKVLSETDKSFLNKTYPFDSAPPPIDDREYTEIILRFAKGESVPDFQCLVSKGNASLASVKRVKVTTSKK